MTMNRNSKTSEKFYIVSVLKRIVLRCVYISFVSLLSVYACAQKDSTAEGQLTTRSIMIGVGGTNILDTYLSPEEYTGTEVRLLRENSRMTHWAKGRVSTQTIVQGNLSYSSNRADTGNELAGLLSYSVGWHYNWYLLNGNLRLQAGSLFEANLGFIYNTRNSNNPAQAKAFINISPSVIATYRFKIKEYPLSLRYQANIPVVGVMFSPNYGQSYYEIFSEGNYDHNIVPTTIFCSPSFYQMFSVDFNIWNTTFRIGYLGDFKQSKVNNLKTHTYSNMFMIGVVKHFKLIKIKP